MGFSADFFCWCDDSLRPALRQRLHLPAQAADPYGYRSVTDPVEHPRWGKLWRIERLSPEETEAAFQRWHNEHPPLHERLLERGLDLACDAVLAAEGAATLLDPRSMRRRRRSWLNRHRASDELAGVRHIRYMAYHTVEAGVSTSIDGRILLPSGASFPLDFVCAGNLTGETADLWTGGAVAGGEAGYGERGCPVIILPTQTLFEDACREALVRWYMERFEYVHGHWAVRSRTLPSFELDIGFYLPGDRYAWADALATIATDRALLQRLDGPGDLSWPHFGRVLTARERAARGF